MKSNANTIQGLIEQGTHELIAVSDTARLDAEILLAHVMNRTRSHLYMYLHEKPSDDECRDFFECLAVRKNGVPVAYIQSYKEFWSMRFVVNANVLIPRPETELLVDTMLSLTRDRDSGRVLELGTGSGAIICAFLSEKPNWHAVATDISSAAIQVAKQNAEVLAIHRVEFIESDWFNAISKQTQYDLIVSNPPYINADDPHLTGDGVRHEPLQALVAGQQGLACLNDIIDQAPAFLSPGGSLVLEHGHEQQAQLTTRLASRGFKQVVGYKDINSMPRAVSACYG